MTKTEFLQQADIDYIICEEVGENDELLSIRYVDDYARYSGNRRPADEVLKANGYHVSFIGTKAIEYSK